MRQGKQMDLDEVNRTLWGTASIPTGIGLGVTPSIAKLMTAHTQQHEALHMERNIELQNLQRARAMSEQLNQGQLRQQRLMMQQNHQYQHQIQEQMHGEQLEMMATRNQKQQHQQQQTTNQTETETCQGIKNDPGQFGDLGYVNRPLTEAEKMQLHKKWVEDEERKEAALAEAEMEKMWANRVRGFDMEDPGAGQMNVGANHVFADDGGQFNDLDTEMSVCSLNDEKGRSHNRSGSSSSSRMSGIGSRNGSGNDSRGSNRSSTSSMPQFHPQLFTGKDDNGQDYILDLPVSSWDAFLDNLDG